MKLWLWVYKLLKCKYLEVLYAIIAITFFVLIDSIVLKRDFNIRNYFELKMITSISATYVIALILNQLTLALEQRVEDYLKINYDKDFFLTLYHEDRKKMPYIIKKSGNLEFHEDEFKWASLSEMITHQEESGLIDTFPILVVFLNKGSQTLLIKDNPEKMYVLPTIIQNEFLRLFSAHRRSSVYNSIVIRLDDIEANEDNIIMYTSRTTYFSSLVTNRVMDFELTDHITVRKLFEFNSSVSPLCNSLLSNHLGMNFLVFSSDSKLLLVKRFGNLSIGKNIIGCSVSASIKTKYCLDESGEFTTYGLRKAIQKEALDELGLTVPVEEISLANNLIAIYRDLFEGGKPQMLFAYKSKLSSTQITKIFEEEFIQNTSNRRKTNDGNTIHFFDIFDIKVKYSSIVNTRNNVEYRTNPPTSICIAFGIDWYKKNQHI